MSLDVTKLEKVRHLTNGTIQARCPACAEDGHDHKGDHLHIYADGRFGCCVHAKDRSHRKRIFALAGERGRKAIAIKVASRKGSGPIQGGLFNRLAPVFAGAAKGPDRPDALGEVVTPLSSRTRRTPESESAEKPASARTGRTGQPELSATLFNYPRTLRTPSSLPTRMGSEIEKDIEESREGKELIGSAGGVRSVRPESSFADSGEPVRPVRQPHFTPGGALVIPFDSDPKYHWWRGGQSVAETRAELLRQKLS